MEQGLVLPLLPTVQHRLDTSQSSVTWVVTANLLAASVFTPIMGRIGDMTGKRRVLLVALGGLAVGGLLAALATSMTVMILARVVQGLGGGLLPLAFGIIRDEFPPERVNGAIGALASLIAVGGGLSTALAGPINDALGYTWLWWIPMIVAAAATAVAFVVVPESPIRLPGRLGWRAPLLLTGWLVALLLGVSKAPEWGWTSVEVLGLIMLAAVLVVLWVRVELDSPTPLVDMRMMRLPAVWTTNLANLLLGFSLFAGVAFIPQLVQTDPSSGYGLGATVTEASLLMVPQFFGLFLVGSLAGLLTRRFTARRALFWAAVVSIVPWAILTGAHDHAWQIALSTAVMGAGFGLAFAVAPGIIVLAVPPSQTSVATGMNANIRTIGSAIGTAVMSTIVTSTAGADGIPTEGGYTAGFAMLVAVTAVAAAACLLVPRPARGGDEAGDSVPQPHTELALTPTTRLE
jgi:MFS family permease